MFDIRSQLVSMVAVFLALGLGLLMGTTLLGEDVLLEKQRGLITQLEKEFQALRDQNFTYRTKLINLEKQLAVHDEFESRLLPLVARGRLDGRRVMVVILGDGDGETLRRSMEVAGVNLVGTMSLPGLPFPPDEEDRGFLQSLIGLTGGTWIESLPALARHLAQELDAEVWGLATEESDREGSEATGGSVEPPNHEGPDNEGLPGDGSASGVSASETSDERDAPAGTPAGSQSLLPLLTKKNLISLPASMERPEAIILLAGKDHPSQVAAQYFYAPLGETLAGMGYLVIGAEYVGTTPSLVPFFKDVNLSTVDNVDSVAGQVALILVLGGARGNFGVKQAADGILPGAAGTEPEPSGARREILIPQREAMRDTPVPQRDAGGDTQVPQREASKKTLAPQREASEKTPLPQRGSVLAWTF